MMGLAWFGNMDWNDDRPPTSPVPVKCDKCGHRTVWNCPLTYDKPCPFKHDGCGGRYVYRAEPGDAP